MIDSVCVCVCVRAHVSNDSNLLRLNPLVLQPHLAILCWPPIFT